MMDCRCGIQHETPDSCVEVSIYSLSSGSNNVASHVKHPIPRNPEVAELVMRSVSSSNHLSSAIFNIMRHYQSKDLATTAALFFLYYRLFRVCDSDNGRINPRQQYTDKTAASLVAYASNPRVSRRCTNQYETDSVPKCCFAPCERRSPAVARSTGVSMRRPNRRHTPFGAVVCRFDLVCLARGKEFYPHRLGRQHDAASRV